MLVEEVADVTSADVLSSVIRTFPHMYMYELMLMCKFVPRIFGNRYLNFG